MAHHLDFNFIKADERVTSFNISIKEFQSLNHKHEIQHLVNKHFFPGFDVENTISSSTIKKADFNRVFDSLKKHGNTNLLHQYNLKGVGPGEVSLYFIYDKATLGGGSSAGMDIAISSTGYEVKAVNVTNQFFSDFKLGGTVDLDKHKMDLNKLRGELKIGGSVTEISGSRMKEIQNKMPDEYQTIEEQYRENAFNNYFKTHEIIFMYNKGPNVGKIADVRKVKKQDIFMERVTSGTLKPLIRI